MLKENKLIAPVAIEKMKNADNFEYTVQMTRWLLQPLGVWPLKSTTYPSILRLLSILMSAFLLAFILIPGFLHLILIEKNFRTRVMMIGPITFTIQNTFKYFGVLFKKSKFKGFIIDMASDWHGLENSDQEWIMLKKAKTARIFTTICALFMYGGGLPYSTILPLTRGVTIVGNISYRHLAYQSYLIFFDPHMRPMYDLVFTLHCLSGFVMYSLTCGLCSFAIICIMHICGQCIIISDMLRNIKEKMNEKSIEKIVNQHLRALKFASNLENILNDLCLVEIFGSTFNICMLGYYFITEFENSEAIGLITYFFLFASLTFNVFIFCYIGDLLTEQCRLLGDVAYAINWYQLSGKEARNIILIVISTQRPVVLTAGKIITLSVGNFCNIMKASFTYLNMLRTLTANES